MCIILKKRTKRHDKYFGYCFILYHISSAQLAARRKNLSNVLLAKINTLLACSQMLAKTILYPS